MNISILMPVYNSEKYLKEAIESILNQSFTKFEFIIINDGSTDASEEIIKSYNDERIKYFKNIKNMGLIYTLNRGIEMCNGKYIARMDSDDISEVKRIEKQVEFLEKNEHVDVLGGAIRIIQCGKKSKYYKPVYNWDEIKANMFFRCEIVHPAVMYRKKFLDKFTKVYNENFATCEDYELWSRSISKYCFANLDEIILNYRIVENGITQTADLQKNKEVRDKLHNEIYVKFLKYIELKPSNEELELHRNLSKENGIEDLKILNLTEKYLKKLIQYNAKTNYINQEIMSKQISYWWYRVCRRYKNSFQGMKSFYKSDLGQAYKPTIKEYIAFFKKYE